MLWFPILQEQNVASSRILFHVENEQQRMPSNSAEERVLHSKMLLENLLTCVSWKAKMQIYPSRCYSCFLCLPPLAFLQPALIPRPCQPEIRYLLFSTVVYFCFIPGFCCLTGLVCFYYQDWVLCDLLVCQYTEFIDKQKIPFWFPTFFPSDTLVQRLYAILRSPVFQNEALKCFSQYNLKQLLR